MRNDNDKLKGCSTLLAEDGALEAVSLFDTLADEDARFDLETFGSEKTCPYTLAALIRWKRMSLGGGAKEMRFA